MNDEKNKLGNSNRATPEQIADLIARRKTFKVLAEVGANKRGDPDKILLNNSKVKEAIRTAGWAPFHYDRGEDGLPEPWRVHVLWHQDCQTIATEFHNWFEGVKPSNKLPAMLSACGALVLVTWLPQFNSGNSASSELTIDVTPEKQIAIDEEHLAASAAMVQNLLLMLTAHSMGTYWSSGGQFRLPEMFARLGIPLNERLLAAVFVEYPETSDLPFQRLAGKHRENRSQDFAWMREIKLAQ